MAFIQTLMLLRVTVIRKTVFSNKTQELQCNLKHRQHVNMSQRDLEKAFHHHFVVVYLDLTFLVFTGAAHAYC